MEFDILKSLSNEFTHESAGTRKILERIPMDNLSWKPHEKSMSIGNLATHLVELEEWIPVVIEQNGLDFATAPYQPKKIESIESLLKEHDDAVSLALQTIGNADVDALKKETWTMRNGETIYFSLPKIATLRSFAFNHLYHHRAQLTVYFRLLGIPVPGLYGPSADES